MLLPIHTHPKTFQTCVLHPATQARNLSFNFDSLFFPICHNWWVTKVCQFYFLPLHFLSVSTPGHLWCHYPQFKPGLQEVATSSKIATVLSVNYKLDKVMLLLKIMPSHGMQAPEVSCKTLQYLSLAHSPDSFHISPCLIVYNSTKPQPFMVHTHKHTHTPFPAFAQVPPLPGTFITSLTPSLLAWLTLTGSLRLKSGKLFLKLCLFYPSLGWLYLLSGPIMPGACIYHCVIPETYISCPHFYPHHLVLSVLPPKHMSFSPHCSYLIWAFFISHLTCCGGLPLVLPILLAPPLLSSSQKDLSSHTYRSCRSSVESSLTFLHWQYVASRALHALALPLSSLSSHYSYPNSLSSQPKILKPDKLIPAPGPLGQATPFAQIIHPLTLCVSKPYSSIRPQLKCHFLRGTFHIPSLT